MHFTETIQSFLPTWNDQIYRLGMGCATIGHAADSDGLERFHSTLESAYDAGLRYIDTSAQYGGSEFRVGRFIRTVNRKEIFVASKSPIPTALSPAEAAMYVEQGLRNSLERLNVMQIDLFQVHDVDTLDQVLVAGGVFDMLRRTKAEGKIRFFGLATRNHALSRHVLEHGGFDTILTYSDYTPINNSAADLIEQAAQLEVGVINGSPLAFGMLTGRDPRSLHRNDPDYLRSCDKAIALYEECLRRGLPITIPAMQYPLANANISVTLTGPCSPEELKATVDSCTHPLSRQDWEDLQQTCGIAIPKF